MSTQLTLDIDKAIQEKDKGIKRAIDHANEVVPDWAERAFEMLKDWLKGWASGYKFMMEDFRQVSKIRGLPDPPSERAFGGIALRAKNAGLVKSVGTKPVKNVNANRCFATEWEKI